jgi:hypothetical protein
MLNLFNARRGSNEIWDRSNLRAAISPQGLDQTSLPRLDMSGSMGVLGRQVEHRRPFSDLYKLRDIGPNLASGSPNQAEGRIQVTTFGRLRVARSPLFGNFS